MTKENTQEVMNEKYWQLSVTIKGMISLGGLEDMS